LSKEDLRLKIVSTLNKLPNIARIILVLYYHEGLSHSEISIVLNVRKTEIERLHSNALTYMSIIHPSFVYTLPESFRPGYFGRNYEAEEKRKKKGFTGCPTV
jgi:hypothetical protein